jgi:hypothetical protein
MTHGVDFCKLLRLLIQACLDVIVTVRIRARNRANISCEDKKFRKLMYGNENQYYYVFCD